MIIAELIGAPGSAAQTQATPGRHSRDGRKCDLRKSFWSSPSLGGWTSDAPWRVPSLL
jgi:hypothetical protein